MTAIGGGGLAAAMAAGAAGSLAGTAAVGVINHRGNLGATFSDTLSSDSLKSAVTAAASAGVAKGLDSVWGGSTDPVTGRTVGVDLDSASGWGRFRFAGQRASQALAEAGIDTAVQGGSFGDHFRTRLQNATSTVLQATLFNQVGNLGLANDLADGGSEKVALHALAGGLAAAASGGDFKSGALAAGANEALVEQLATLVDNDPQLLTAASQITGIVAAGLADGDVQQGAEIAGNATTYNRLMHADEQAWIKEHADSKEEQAKLTVAACALIECSAQFDKDSDQYAYYKQLETLGGSEAYAQEKQKLQASGLFTYSRWNGLTDGLSRYQVGNRAMGAVQVFNGTAAAIAGSALAGTGLGSALGGLMLGWGADNAAAGTVTAFNGQPTPTFGAQALQQAGISPEVAGAIYDLAGMAGAAGMVKTGAGALSGSASVSVGKAAIIGSNGVSGAKTAGTVFGNTERGVLAEANFAQNRIKSDRSFSPDGQKIYSDLAGEPIMTVDDLTGALKAGTIKESQIPVDYVDLNGTRLILNTRTSTALEQAGIPRSRWFGRNQTGVEAYPGKTFNELAADQLKNNKLPPTGAAKLKSVRP